MKAVRIVQLKSPLEEQNLPDPVLVDGEVLVRIKAAGICHSDAHYRSGAAPPAQLPITPGHEIAGIVEKTGRGSPLGVGAPVCVHYMKSCGSCRYCLSGREQFCADAAMIGKYCDGGYAEYIAVPERNLHPIPEQVTFAEAAVMMCSTTTSYHALRKTGLEPGESVAVFGVGGLGMSAIQLSYALGAEKVFAVDIDADRLSVAESLGALPVDAAAFDPATQIFSATDGNGVDVCLELVGIPATIDKAVESVGISGRIGLVGIGDRPVSLDVYRRVIGKEAVLFGVSDHLNDEVASVLDLAASGKISVGSVVTETVPLKAESINRALDRLDEYGSGLRSVITPGV